tara:strand:- start:1417 stop:1557 length:141 start_codon:yes stop_codon:yes gene_type:complete
MGRVTQFINYINEKYSPQSHEMDILYPHIEFTEKVKDARKKYRRKK